MVCYLIIMRTKKEFRTLKIELLESLSSVNDEYLGLMPSYFRRVVSETQALNEKIIDYLLLTSVNNSIIPSSVMIPITFPLFSGSTIGIVSNG